MYMVHVKVPGYTAQDTLTVVFEAGTLVIDGQMERVASDCVSGRRLGMVGLGSVFTMHVAVYTLICLINSNFSEDSDVSLTPLASEC